MGMHAKIRFFHRFRAVTGADETSRPAGRPNPMSSEAALRKPEIPPFLFLLANSPFHAKLPFHHNGKPNFFVPCQTAFDGLSERSRLIFMRQKQRESEPCDDFIHTGLWIARNIFVFPATN